MRLTKSWRSGGDWSVKFLGGLLCLGMACGFLVPTVLAEPVMRANDTQVSPGAGTLKKAVSNAQEGDTLYLKSGSFTGSWSDEGGREVVIDKNLTIDGQGKATIDVPIRITGESKTVTLKNFYSPMTEVERDFVYVTVDAKNVNLTMDNVTLTGILRAGDDGRLPIHDATGISIKEGANGSQITLKDTEIIKPGVHYGILNKASNTTITVGEGSIVEGRVAIEFDNGSDNVLNVENGGTIAGPAVQYRDNEIIAIKNQINLNINLDGGKIEGEKLNSNEAIKVFAIDENSMKVKIDLKNNSEINYEVKEGNSGVESTIFGFDVATTADKGHEITVDGSSRIYRSVIDKQGYQEVKVREERVEVEREYSTLNNRAVIAVFDKDGGRKIKIYDEGAKIEGLEDDQNIVKEGYNFKGWFKRFDGEKTYSEPFTKDGENYPNAQKGQNMDLYPKFLKQIKVTVDGQEYSGLEEGQTLNDLKDTDIDTRLEELSNKEGVNFKGFVMHGEDGSEFSYTTKELGELKSQEIPDNVTIEAFHDVTLTVNDQKFDLEIGQSASQIKNQDEYNAAKMDSEAEKYFSRLVYGDGDETFEDTTPIFTNTTVTTKHNRLVTIEGDGTEYLIEEGKKLTDNQDLVTALNTLQETPVENKSFGRFEDNNGKTVDLEEYTVEGTTTLKPIYTVEVKIGENTYTLDNGQSLNKYEDQDGIKNALKQLIEKVKDLKTEFKGFVLSSGDTEKVIEANADEAEGKINEVLQEVINGNTDIFAKYAAKVTIKCPGCDGGQAEFEVETGSKLADLLDNERKDNYEKAKYQQYEEESDRDERFGGFTIEGEEGVFGEDQAIEKSMTLTPKYYLFVTIEDERPEVEGKFRIESGKDLDEMVPMSGQSIDVAKVLLELRSDITPEVDAEGNVIDPEADDLHFDSLEKKVGERYEKLMDEIINEDTAIRALYHYDVIIVENYDQPNMDLGGAHEAQNGFKVYRGHGLGEADEAAKIEGALTNLKTSVASKEGRRFYRYLDGITGKTYDEEELKSKAFNRHLYITAKVEYKVTVEGDPSEYYVIDGETIGSSDALEGEMDEFKVVQGKEFTSFTLNGKEISEDDLLATLVNDVDNTIGAKYNVVVTIGGQEFRVPEGGTLEEEVDGKQQEARDALQALQNEIIEKEQKFDGYSVGNEIDDVMKYPFEANSEVVGKSSITVTIDGTPYEGLQTGDTIAEKVLELNNHKASCNTRDMDFSRFADVNGNDFAENTPLAKLETLITKCAYKVTIDGDDTYRVEEGLALNDVLKVSGKLDELEKAKPEKTFGRFIDTDDNSIIDRNATLEKNLTIKPIYLVEVSIDEEKYYLDEGGSLNSVSGVESLLDKLEQPGNKIFGSYVVEGHEIKSREELLRWPFNDNTTVIMKYNVGVTINGETFEIPEGTKLANANELRGKMESYEVPEGKSRVAYFVDEDGNQIGDDSVFATNTELTPKYMIAVKVTGQDDEGEPIEVEPLELELLEGSSLSELSEGEKQKLQDWVKENQLVLAKTGKEKYDLDHFVNEHGELVGMETPLSGGPVELTAAFAYKPEVEPTPEPMPTPTPGTTVDEETTNAGAPDTGSETNNEISANVGNVAIIVLVILISGITVTIMSRRLRKK